MSHGPGKYDDACTVARESTEALAVALIVVGGHSGSGFSVQGPRHLLARLPGMLRFMANEIERDHANGDDAAEFPPSV
jgi:hypothetical protein